MAEVRCLFAFEHRVRTGRGGGMHRHPCTEIVVTRAGSGVLVHGERRFRFGPGDILIYQPDAAHRVDQLRTGWHLCLGVLGCGAGDLKPGVYGSSKGTEQMCSRIRSVLANRPREGSAEIELLAGLLVLDLSRMSGGRTANELPVQRARNLIDSDYAKPLTLPNLATAVFVSADYLRQLFRREYGISPMRYLLARRIDVARNLLSLTQASISEISTRCGFNDVFYFSRAFKKVIGMPPRDYRERYSFSPETLKRAE